MTIEGGPATGCDVLAVPVFAGRVWGPGAAAAAAAAGDRAGDFFDTTEFSGKAGSLAFVPGDAGHAAIVFLGLGDEVDVDGLRRAAGALARATRRSSSVATTLHRIDIEGAAAAVASGFLLGAYEFTEYQTAAEPAVTERLVLIDAGAEPLADAEHAAVVAEAVCLARDMINEPAAAKSPEALAQRMAAATEPLGVRVEIKGGAELAAGGFGGVVGVGAGAHNPPRLVEMWWEPPAAQGLLAIVGKGIVFDSGGLSLKTAKGMETMKTDMSGAAAVAATLAAVARLRLPVRVLGIAPLAENMPGGGATRPGDVLRIRNGKTIEVLNTDAEGRLVLADGLALACEADPDLVVDIATLTGSTHVALGDEYAGLWANGPQAAAQVLTAAARAGELVWRMPLHAPYRKQLDSDVADMKNRGDRYGGGITAALLLEEFVDDRPWAHLDIAGPARAAKASGYVTPGGTGFGVRTLVALAEDLAG